MISATVREGARQVTVTWMPAAGLRIRGDADLTGELHGVFQPGAVAWYNPRLGGLYDGFDSADPVQVRDGLAYLARRLKVNIEQDDVPPAEAPIPIAGPGDIDWTDEGAVNVLRPSAWAQLFPARPDRPMARKGRFVLLAKARRGPSPQVVMFGGLASAPAPAPVASVPSSKPPGSGWEPIPAGHHGGYRRRRGDGWDYWYPSEGHARRAADYHHDLARLAEEDSLPDEQAHHWAVMEAAGMWRTHTDGEHRRPETVEVTPELAASEPAPSPVPSPTSTTTGPAPLTERQLWEAIWTTPYRAARSADHRKGARSGVVVTQAGDAVRIAWQDVDGAGDAAAQVKGLSGALAAMGYQVAPEADGASALVRTGGESRKQPAAAPSLLADAERRLREKNYDNSLPHRAITAALKRRDVSPEEARRLMADADKLLTEARVIDAGLKPQRPTPVATVDGYPDPDAQVPNKVALGSLTKIRQRAERLIEVGQDAQQGGGLENTWRRASMAANKRERGEADERLGLRLRRFADAVEAGYEPSHFEIAAATDQRVRDVASLVARRHTEGVRQSVGVPVHVPTWKLDSKEPGERQAAELMLRLARRYGHQAPNNDYWMLPPDPKIIKPLREAWSKVKDVATRPDPWHLALEAEIHAGLRTVADAPRVAERWKAWQTLTDPGARQGASSIPDRSGARRPLAERLARAEREEARWFVHPAHKDIPGYFPTPAPVVERLVEHADIRPGMSVLEPSAGTGSIADRLPGDAEIQVAEASPRLREELSKKGYARVQSDGLSVEGQFDRVVMNPPFEDGQDMAHVRHAFEHNLKSGGRLVAITGPGWTFRQDATSAAFRDFVATHGRVVEEHDPAIWKRSNTAVPTRMIVLDKPAGG